MRNGKFILTNYEFPFLGFNNISVVVDIFFLESNTSTEKPKTHLFLIFVLLYLNSFI